MTKKQGGIRKASTKEQKKKYKHRLHFPFAECMKENLEGEE
jgi:hypothetical protein